jgi:hypothetical protein
MTDETRPGRPDPDNASAEAAAGEPFAAPDGEPEVISIEGDRDRVSASVLHVERGGINEATAETIEVRMGGIGRLDGGETFVQWGGVGLAKADKVAVEYGGIGAALTGELRVTQGFAGNILAREAIIEQALARTVIAQRVTISRPSAVLVLVAAKVEGNVKPLLDWRGGLALGATIGVAVVAREVIRSIRDA